MAKKTYYEKLKDPQWQKKRLEVMQAHDFTCELCGETESTLHVHHKEYFKGHEPWEYDNGQLACLCERCHENQHFEFDILKWVCSYARLDGPENRIELAILLSGYMGMPYDGILSVSCMDDISYYKKLHSIGVKAHTESNKSITAIAKKMKSNG